MIQRPLFGNSLNFELRIIELIIQNKNNGLPIIEKRKSDLLPRIENLNSLFNSYGLHFGIVDNKLYIQEENEIEKVKSERGNSGPKIKKTQAVKEPTNLDSEDQINFLLGDKTYEISQRVGNGNMTKFLLIIKGDGDLNQIAEVQLTTKEFELFRLLATNINQVVSVKSFGAPTLSSLRSKLSGMIRNKRGEGYYIGVLSNHGFDLGEDNSVDLRSINALIEQASIGYTPGNNEGRLPNVKRKKTPTKNTGEEDVLPMKPEELENKFNIKNFI